MTENHKPQIENDMSRYIELEQYMPRQVVLAQSQDHKATQEGSGILSPMKGMGVYQSLIDSVKTSSMAIRELARVKQELMHQNQELQSQYEQQLSELHEFLDNEKSKSNALELELKTLKSGYQQRLDELSARCQELQSENFGLSEKLENQTADFNKIRGILDYLVFEVNESLDETLKELNVIS